MKLILISFLFPVLLFAQDLNLSQKTAVLSELKNACADSWCAGDYVWKFAELNCNFTIKKCEIELRLIDTVLDQSNSIFNLPNLNIFEYPGISMDSDELKISLVYTQICPLLNYKSLSDIYDSKKNSYTQKLNDSISACTNKMKDLYLFIWNKSQDSK